jgi:hypothetical protein
MKMKKHRREGQEMRDRRRKMVLRRIQEQEWKEQWQNWALDEESSSADPMSIEQDRDSA